MLDYLIMVDLVKWVCTLSLYTLDFYNSLFSLKNCIWSNHITTDLKYLHTVGDNLTQSYTRYLIIVSLIDSLGRMCPDLTSDLYLH